MSNNAGRPVRARKVNGVMNSLASRVITTLTTAPCCTSLLARSAALKAAMLPQTPSTILRSVNIAVPRQAVVFVHLVDQSQAHQRQVRVDVVERPRALGDTT